MERDPHPAEVSKWEKESLLSEAEREKVLVETVKLQAEAKYQEALAREQIAKAAVAELNEEREREKRIRELATNEYHHLYTFVDSVNERSVRECMGKLTQWHRLDPACSIEIIFNSPGGEVVNGMALFDFIIGLREEGHTIITAAQGMAASMAGILLQSGTKRIMSKQSWLLIHQASFGAMGSFGEVEDQVLWVRKIQERILDIFADRAKHSKTDSPITRAQIKKNWERRDWWISSDDALKHGFVDQIVSVI